jgi:hypothetical protein
MKKNSEKKVTKKKNKIITATIKNPTKSRPSWALILILIQISC